VSENWKDHNVVLSRKLLCLTCTIVVRHIQELLIV